MRGAKGKAKAKGGARAVGVYKSEKRAWGGAGGSGVAAGRVSDSVATARALALAQAQALVPQRRVGVAIVMMWDAAEGKGAFRCGLLLRLRRGLPHWLPAAGSLALSPCRALSLPRVSVCAARAREWGAASKPAKRPAVGMCGMRRPDLPSGSSG